MAVLQKDRREKLEKMTQTRTLPVLLDNFEGVFAETYAANASQALYFFDRQGCLVPNKIETGSKIMIDAAAIRAALRSMAG